MHIRHYFITYVLICIHFYSTKIRALIKVGVRFCFVFFALNFIKSPKKAQNGCIKKVFLPAVSHLGMYCHIDSVTF